jgi:hypothetical protein
MSQELIKPEDLIDTRPKDMPLELVYELDKYTTTQIGSWVLWYMKTVGERLNIITEDIKEHKAAQAAIDWKQVEVDRIKATIAKLRQEAQTMEEELSARLIKECLEQGIADQGSAVSAGIPTTGFPTDGTESLLKDFGTTNISTPLSGVLPTKEWPRG